MESPSLIKNILVLHGWNASPKEHWFPDFCRIMKEKGFRIFAPEMPGDYYPELGEWLKVISRYKLDETWAVVTHSLGGVAIMHYLTEKNIKVGLLLIIAAPFEAMKFRPIENFFKQEIDWKKVRGSARKIELVYESNDVVVPIVDGQRYSKFIGCHLNILPGYSHFHSIDLPFISNLIESSKVKSQK